MTKNIQHSQAKNVGDLTAPLALQMEDGGLKQKSATAPLWHNVECWNA